MASSPGEDQDLLQTAQRMWGVLDRMATENPEEYKTFIEQQLDEGKEALAAPEPVFCLRATLEGGKARYLYLNVCKWSRVPHPKTDNDPIPVKGGVMRHLLHKESKRKTRDVVYDIAFHSDVLVECLKQRELEEMMASLCWDYVENETSLRIANRKDCKKMEVSHKGVLGDIRSSLDEEWRHLLSQDSKMDIGDSILKQLREMKVKKEDEETLRDLKLFPEKAGGGGSIKTHRESDRLTNAPSQGEGSSLDASLNQPRPHGTKMLIQELRSEVVASYEEGDRGRVCVPEHSVGVSECGEEGSRRKREVWVRLKLPRVKTVKEVELEVSQSDLVLDVRGQYHLSLQFPETVDEDEVRATFNTRTATMTVTLSAASNGTTVTAS